jgi:predicted nucleic acid-binding protein
MMTTQRCMVDSNLWLYALLPNQPTTSGDEIDKKTPAIALLNNISPIISTQVINEVCSVMRRKAKFTEPQTSQLIQTFHGSCEIVELTYLTLVQASNIRSRYGFSFWDGLIVASALEANASILYSEDMQAGLLVEGRLTIVNPFV